MLNSQARNLPESNVVDKWKKSGKHYSLIKCLHATIRRVCIALFVIFMVLGLVLPVSTKKVYKCSVCKTISDDFIKGLSMTAGSNYGGGNTNWEERALGSYAKSEIRLVEVMEYVCKDGDKVCHYMLEELEELVETFWYREFGKKNNTDIHNWLCIENVKACCSENTFGPECVPCVGGVERPCTGNGNCDGGGTREGKGTCNCNHGYTGELCDDCADDHYEELKNKTHTICKQCHQSCKSACWEAGPTGCDECKDGYELLEETCTDIDECTSNPVTHTCEENKLCINNEGSYTCVDIPKTDEEDGESINPNENPDENKDKNPDTTEDENSDTIEDENPDTTDGNQDNQDLRDILSESEHKDKLKEEL